MTGPNPGRTGDKSDSRVRTSQKNMDQAVATLSSVTVIESPTRTSQKHFDVRRREAQGGRRQHPKSASVIRTGPGE